MKTTASRLNVTTTGSGVGSGHRCLRDSGSIAAIGSERIGAMKSKDVPTDFANFGKMPLVEARGIVLTTVTP